jgi:amino acid transporter
VNAPGEPAPGEPAPSAPAPSAAAAGGPGLRRNALGLMGAVALAVAFTGPAGSIYFGEAAAANKAGGAFAFSFILAGVGVLLMAHSIAQFSRKLATSGFGFSYVTAAYGPSAGAYTGWLLLLGYLPIPALLLAALGAVGQQFCQSYLGADVPWYVFSLALGVIAVTIVNLGVRRSVRTTLIFLAWELLATTALFVTIIARGGVHGNSIQPFNPVNSPSTSGLAYGLLWGFVLFFGFESAGTLGEEATQSRRTVPRALYAAVGIMTVFYVLSAYAATIGVGVGDTAKFATSGWSGLVATYWGHWAGWLLDLTVMNSFFAILLAALNASVRILYSMARAGVLPRPLGELNPKTQIPAKAGLALMGLVLVVVLAGGFTWGALSTWYFLSVLTALALLLVYLAIHASLPRFYRTRYRAEFSWWRHAVLPGLGGLIVLLPLYGSIWPISPYPLSLVPWVFLAWLLLGVVYVRVGAARRARVAAAMRTAFEQPGQGEPAGH